MDPTALVASLQEAVPGAELESAAVVDLQATVYAKRDDLPAIARALRDGAGLKFDFLAELTAVDFWPREPRFELVYMLVSIEHRQRVRAEGAAAGDDAHVATVSDVWPAANWLEREVWDLFGIVFDGHPDPRRLLMPEDWEGLSAAQGLSGADQDDAAHHRAAAGDRGRSSAPTSNGSAGAQVTEKTPTQIVSAMLAEAAALHERIRKSHLEPVVAAAEAIVASLKSGGKLLLFGNGGSAADAQHVAAELVGRFQRERAALAAIALTTDTSVLTAIGNDDSYERVFARQVEALGRAGRRRVRHQHERRSRPTSSPALETAKARGCGRSA